MNRPHRLPYWAAALVLLMNWFCTFTPAAEGVNSITELYEHFSDPPAEYRSAPLWDWNEQVTEAGIDFQMREFKRAGIGGVFVHPRPGLLTEYLSDEWFHLFDHAVQKGKELGLKVWIYDENSYPSGFAGGHVPAEMPDSYQHGTGLSLEVQHRLSVDRPETVEVVLEKTVQGFEDITRNLDSKVGKGGTFYIFRKTFPARSLWYGGYSYVDLLYPGVTEKFMELTMKKGYERNRADFGKTLPGIFTDEPNLEAAMPAGSVMRWTPGLFDVFRQRYDYDLKVKLPSLVEETGNWKKVRHDYYQLLLELFVDRWAKPWQQYCEQQNLIWTGHYWEHGWPQPTHGMDEAAFYIWHQMPGVDMLGSRLEPAGLGGQFGNDRAVRELRSAANQAGRKRTLSETYGGGGWEMTFETQKRLLDWEGVLGVNFVNQHLSYYSLNGVRKYDYPPSFSYHEPWWRSYKLLGDYIGRVGMAMSAGEQLNTTLVLQPNTTAWMYFSRKQRNPNIQTIERDFKSFVYHLEQQHLEYDLGSEKVLRDIGAVIENKLKVGQRAYSLVVIPAEMENFDRSTFELLRKYVQNGGKVLAFRKGIPLLDAVESDAINELASSAAENWTTADNLQDPDALNLLASSGFTLNDKTANGALYHQRRTLHDGELVFVVNCHPTEKAVAEISLGGKYVSKLDLLTGETFRYPAEAKNGKVTFEIPLPPVGSALFAITDQAADEPVYKPVAGTEAVLEATDDLDVTRESDNVLVIDVLDLKTEKGERKGIYCMNATAALFAENGVPDNPWQHKIQYKQKYLALDARFGPDSRFTVQYHFHINPNLDGSKFQEIRAVVERPELWTVSINGNEVRPTPDAYWIDKGFPVFAVGNVLKHGSNTLTISAPRMHIRAEVMPVYLLGDFDVTPAERGFEIARGTFGALGSWRQQGLPFYSQQVAYRQNYSVAKQVGTEYLVRLKEWNGTVAEVLVNGKVAGPIAWQPYERNVTSMLKDGNNEIVVKVTGSLKNTFGPFYQKSDWIAGPHSWNYFPKQAPASEGYFLVDYGLMQPFELIHVK